MNIPYFSKFKNSQLGKVDWGGGLLPLSLPVITYRLISTEGSYPYLFDSISAIHHNANMLACQHGLWIIQVFLLIVVATVSGAGEQVAEESLNMGAVEF
jgi:hypothetical protein